VIERSCGNASFAVSLGKEWDIIQVIDITLFFE
jgi:hypothetical protein